jgi:hypothetical protein
MSKIGSLIEERGTEKQERLPQAKSAARSHAARMVQAGSHQREFAGYADAES